MKILLALGVVSLAFAQPAIAREAPNWRAINAETGKISDVEGLEQLARDFPDSGSVRVRLLSAYLGAEKSENALEVLAWLKGRGHVFDPRLRERILRMIGGDRSSEAAALLLPEAEPIEASELATSVPASAGLIESVFAPEEEGVFLVTSVTENSVFFSAPGVDWTPIPLGRANDLSGIVSDATRDIGWIASSNIDGSEDAQEAGFVGLIGLTGGISDTLYLPALEGVKLSDLAVASDGTVYASDPVGGGVYRAPNRATQIFPLLSPGILRSPQGIAVSESGEFIYVSDYRYGIAMVDLESGRVSRLESDVPILLDGVDGLWLHDGELIAVQNGASPNRISAFKLSSDGARIVSTRVLEQAHSEWTEPLGGSIVGDTLVYVATGQWDRYKKGVPIDGKPAIATQIRRLPLK